MARDSFEMVRAGCIRQEVIWTATAALLLSTATAPARDRQSPEAWLDRMAEAVASTDYEGTVIRRQNGETRALKVVHKIVDGVVNEKVITQEGKGLEIIRVGNEVHCILPDSKSVLIEEWSDQGSLFSTLPSSEIRFGNAYDLSLVREERVAGRPAVLLAVRPHDAYRFGHRLWLDSETAFPLRTEVIGNDGRLIEQLKFADIDLDSGVPAEALVPSIDLENFTWYTEPQRPRAAEIETDWVCDDLPTGFRVISTRTETLPGASAPVTHIVFGDGLATVSVFIAAKPEQEIARRSSVGVSNSYSIERDGHQVTAVGEVPSITVQRIASAMRRE